MDFGDSSILEGLQRSRDSWASNHSSLSSLSGPDSNDTVIVKNNFEKDSILRDSTLRRSSLSNKSFDYSNGTMKVLNKSVDLSYDLRYDSTVFYGSDGCGGEDNNNLSSITDSSLSHDEEVEVMINPQSIYLEC